MEARSVSQSLRIRVALAAVRFPGPKVRAHVRVLNSPPLASQFATTVTFARHSRGDSRRRLSPADPPVDQLGERTGIICGCLWFNKHEYI